MIVRPVTLREAQRFVAEAHRHNQPPRGWLFGCGLDQDGRLVGVAVAGRPNARPLQDGWTVEITRVTTLGGRNACSQLYGAVCRAAKALGYRRAYTYTLASEPGTSPRAAGFRRDADLSPRAGWYANRPRYDSNLLGEAITPPEGKVRWVRDL